LVLGDYVDDVTFYGSFEEMMEAEEKARKVADARVKPTQANIKPGQYFVNFRYGKELPIFGEILDIKKLGVDEEEQTYVDDSYGQPHMRFYRPTRAYSMACEWGEVGDIHLSEISAIIDRELFQWFKENGWTKPSR
jgi:hypothetical protein